MKFSLRRGILPKYMEFIDEHVFPTIVIGDEHCLLRSGSVLYQKEKLLKKVLDKQ
jgi:hypothetical protein